MLQRLLIVRPFRRCECFFGSAGGVKVSGLREVHQVIEGWFIVRQSAAIVALCGGI
jgi:hypothetical protein